LRFADFFQWEEWAKQNGKTRGKAGQSGKAQAGATGTSAVAIGQSAQVSGSGKGAGAKPQKLGYKEQRELDQMEENISKEEGRLAALETELADPNHLADFEKLQGLSQEVEGLRTKIENLYSRWQELSSKVSR